MGKMRDKGGDRVVWEKNGRIVTVKLEVIYKPFTIDILQLPCKLSKIEHIFFFFIFLSNNNSKT